jgi:hypothetical protein
MIRRAKALARDPVVPAAAIFPPIPACSQRLRILSDSLREREGHQSRRAHRSGTRRLLHHGAGVWAASRWELCISVCLPVFRLTRRRSRGAADSFSPREP